MKRIIVCCGNSMATSSMIETCVTDLCEKNHIPVEIKKCTVVEASKLVEGGGWDLVIPNGRLDGKGTPVISGMPYLTGIGVEKMEADILAQLKD